MKEVIQLKDFLDFHYLSQLTFSPNEKYGAFIVSQCQEDKNTYQKDLYITDGKTCQHLICFKDEQLYIWEDDETILFASTCNLEDQDVTQKGEEKTTFYRVHINSKEVNEVFTIPFKVQSIRQLSHGEYILCVDYHMNDSSLNNSKQSEVLFKENKDYIILDEMPFYNNGVGFTNKRRNSLFLYREKSCEIIRISDEFCQVSDVEVSDDHEVIYYVGEVYQKKSIHKDALYAYHVSKNQNEEVIPAKLWSIQKILYWDKSLLMLASNEKKHGIYENKMFYHVNPQNGDVKLFAFYDNTIGSSVGSDCRYGDGAYIRLYKDKVYFITTLMNKSIVNVLDSKGNIKTLYDHEGSVDFFDIAHNCLYFVGMQDMRLQELYKYDIENRSRTQLSLFNESFYLQKEIRPCIPCEIDQDDLRLYGWVLEPLYFDPSKKYPAILNIHGGPKTVYGKVYYHEMQYWAHKGYFVFFMNPRGSDGRGNQFADIRGQYGTIDYDDIMKFTDMVLKMYPSIDQKRIGVTGGSYGGFMTNWIIGHTHRFQAAVSQRSISNWISFAHTSDIGEDFTLDQQDANTWNNITKLWWHSPLKYANRCMTPTLFIHSDEDYRCPYSEGIQMYSALCSLGIETRLCLFKGENHNLSRSGKPQHRVKRLEEITRWFDNYLCQ